MHATELRRFAAFRSLDAAALETVMNHAGSLYLPGGRWLVRPGRRLSASFFLLDGRVRLLEGRGEVTVDAGSARGRHAVYPGVDGVQTQSPARFLRVEAGLLEQLAGSAGDGRPGMLEVTVEEPSWQRRFLTSPLLQRLEPATWQRILRAMVAEPYAAGACVIRAGEVGRCCYVLAAGEAEIREPVAGRVLAVLRPGSLFGEDALVSGRVRNACVIMRSTGSVVRLTAEQFQACLLDSVVRPLERIGGRRVISLEPQRHPAALWVPLENMRQVGPLLAPASYAIVGGTWPERALAAFLLAELGLDAGPLRTGH